jgi:hypothetical protein
MASGVPARKRRPLSESFCGHEFVVHTSRYVGLLEGGLFVLCTTTLLFTAMNMSMPPNLYKVTALVCARARALIGYPNL